MLKVLKKNNNSKKIFYELTQKLRFSDEQVCRKFFN